MKKDFIEYLIKIEMDRAIRKHPDWPEDIIHAAVILFEEAGELAKACLDFVYFDGIERNVRDEAISVATMAERFLLHFPDHYKLSIEFSLQQITKKEHTDGKE